MVGSEPNFSIIVIEWKDMINERFTLWMIFWCVESLMKHFLNQKKMGCIIERTIERKKGPTILQTISCKFKFIHSINVLYCEFDWGTLWRFHEPHKEISLLSCFKIDAVVTWTLIAQVINIVLRYFAFNFVLLFCMRKKVYNIAHKETKSRIYSSRA